MTHPVMFPPVETVVGEQIRQVAIRAVKQRADRLARIVEVRAWTDAELDDANAVATALHQLEQMRPVGPLQDTTIGRVMPS